MSAFESRILITGLLFICMGATGVWLRKSGHPYKTGILTIHKLVSLGTVVMIGILVYHLHTDAGWTAVETGLVAVTGLLFLFMIVSGGLLSLEKPIRGVLLTLHRVLPVVCALSTAVTVYLLAAGG